LAHQIERCLLAHAGAMEKRLSDTLGLVVSIDRRGEGGVVSIRYRDLDQLDDLEPRLGNKH
jgi:ParB family transcriptional regulator, chromosome partitioning protein